MTCELVTDYCRTELDVGSYIIYRRSVQNSKRKSNKVNTFKILSAPNDSSSPSLFIDDLQNVFNEKFKLQVLGMVCRSECNFTVTNLNPDVKISLNSTKLLPFFHYPLRNKDRITLLGLNCMFNNTEQSKKIDEPEVDPDIYDALTQADYVIDTQCEENNIQPKKDIPVIDDDIYDALTQHDYVIDDEPESSIVPKNTTPNQIENSKNSNDTKNESPVIINEIPKDNISNQSESNSKIKNITSEIHDKDDSDDEPIDFEPLTQNNLIICESQDLLSEHSNPIDLVDSGTNLKPNVLSDKNKYDKKSQSNSLNSSKLDKENDNKFTKPIIEDESSTDIDDDDIISNVLKKKNNSLTLKQPFEKGECSTSITPCDKLKTNPTQNTFSHFDNCSEEVFSILNNKKFACNDFKQPSGRSIHFKTENTQNTEDNFTCTQILDGPTTSFASKENVISTKNTIKSMNKDPKSDGSPILNGDEQFAEEDLFPPTQILDFDDPDVFKECNPNKNDTKSRSNESTPKAKNIDCGIFKEPFKRIRCESLEEEMELQVFPAVTPSSVDHSDRYYNCTQDICDDLLSQTPLPTVATNETTEKPVMHSKAALFTNKTTNRKFEDENFFQCTQELCDLLDSPAVSKSDGGSLVKESLKKLDYSIIDSDDDEIPNSQGASNTSGSSSVHKVSPVLVKKSKDFFGSPAKKIDVQSFITPTKNIGEDNVLMTELPNSQEITHFVTNCSKSHVIIPETSDESSTDCESEESAPQIVHHRKIPNKRVKSTPKTTKAATERGKKSIERKSNQTTKTERSIKDDNCFKTPKVMLIDVKREKQDVVVNSCPRTSGRKRKLPSDKSETGYDCKLIKQEIFPGLDKTGPRSSTPGRKRKSQTSDENPGDISCLSNLSTRSSSRIPCRSVVHTYKVMFTQISNKNYYQTVEKLGGQVVDRNGDVLVAERINRTFKLLLAASLKIPIVSTKWLKKSQESNRFLEPREYLLKDLDGEKKYNFNLKSYLDTKVKFLDGHTVYVTPQVVPPVSELKQLIEVNGGKCILQNSPMRKSSKLNKTSGNVFTVSCLADKNIFSTLPQPRVLPEVILMGIFSLRLDVKKFRLDA